MSAGLFLLILRDAVPRSRGAGGYGLERGAGAYGFGVTCAQGACQSPDRPRCLWDDRGEADPSAHRRRSSSRPPGSCLLTPDTAGIKLIYLVLHIRKLWILCFISNDTRESVAGLYVIVYLARCKMQRNGPSATR